MNLAEPCWKVNKCGTAKLWVRCSRRRCASQVLTDVISKRDHCQESLGQDEHSVSLHDLFVLSIDWNCFKLRDQIVPSTWTLKEVIGLTRFPLLSRTVMQPGCDRIT